MRGMKKRQIWNIAFAAVFLLLFVMEIVAVVALARLNMLPAWLLVVLAAVFLGYDCLMANFMFLRGRRVSKKQARRAAKRRRIIACVLAVVMACGCVVITTVANDVRDALDAVQAPTKDQNGEEAGVTRTVYVRIHDVAEKLEDAADYEFGIVTDYDDVCTQQTVEQIQTQLGKTIRTKGYYSVFEMVDALFTGEIDAMILNSGYVSLLESKENYENFSDQTRGLVDVKIAGTGEELDGSGLFINAEAVIAENGKLKPFIAYISGSDSRQGTLGNGRSDVNILAVVNPETRQILLINTPRDYYVANPAGNNQPDKLTHCGVYGIDCSMEALAMLYEHEVQYFAQINFSGLENLVDAIGGITIHSDAAFELYNGAGSIKVGENQLNGEEALAFARTRKGVEGGDNGRGKNQMKVIKAVIDKAASASTIVSSYSAIMESIDGMFVMNIPTSLIGEVVKRQLSDMSGWNIVTYSATGTDGYAECYSEPGKELYILEPNVASVSKAVKLIDKVYAGEILTDEVINNTI